jgi:glycine/D-amino acid oxidase-like deaminating enzyme
VVDHPRVVVVGAGIAGVATAYFLAVREGVGEVTLVDPRPPLTLTSDKSTECYRNYWPNQPMVSLMNRSIDLFEELSDLSGDAFGLNRRGYLFVTGDHDRLEELAGSARVSSEFGSGEVRIHEAPGTFGPADDGFDLFTSNRALLDQYPYLTDRAVGALLVRRAGWLSAQQLGSWMLDRAADAGVVRLTDGVASIGVSSGAITSVTLTSGRSLPADVVINAAGPLSPGVSAMVGLEMPIHAEIHLKVAFRDHLGVVPRDAPMIIWSDPQAIDWSDEERAALLEQGRDDVTGEMPIFCHGRPEGSADSPYLLTLWEYHKGLVDPVWPIPDDPLYPEVVMRGMTTMVPGLGAYLDRLPHSTVDGGYYSKTPENRPLIGPAGPEGFHLMAGMSGFGVMVSAGAADLVSAHIMGRPLPDYADAFLLERYRDPGYLDNAAVADSGQL